MDGGEVGGVEPRKADMRRAQVLAAAATCFNREGFHAASMASIAAEASMSVGQIYRYFDNKEAVIAALVEQSMESWGARMAALQGRPIDQLLEMADCHADKVGEAGRAALSLEFLAEAARNPRIGDIVRDVDAVIQAELRGILLRAGVPDGEGLRSRINMISMLLDGWAVRAVKNPNIDKAQYLDTLRPLLETLLAPPPERTAI